MFLFLSFKHNACWMWHSTIKVRCRDFIGPVPPSLLIRSVKRIQFFKIKKIPPFGKQGEICII